MRVTATDKKCYANITQTLNLSSIGDGEGIWLGAIQNK